MPDDEDNDLEAFVRQHVTVHSGRGRGYAASTEDELEFIASFARETGILLDPVYSGKQALYHFVKWMEQDQSDSDGDLPPQNALFWHTGGAPGLYDKVSSLSQPQRQNNQEHNDESCHRLDVYGRGIGIDIGGDKER